MSLRLTYRIISTLVIILTWLSGTGCKRQVSNNLSSETAGAIDTVYTQAAAMEMMTIDRNRALTIIDSARIVGNLTADAADILRMKVYLQALEGFQLDSVNAIGTRLMQHDSVLLNPNRRSAVLDMLISSARLGSNDEQLLTLTEQKAETCRELGQNCEALRTDVERGAAMARLGHMDEGLKIIDNVIARLDGIRRFNEMDTWIIAIRRKINILDNIPGLSSQTANLCLRILSRIDDYAQNPDIYSDGHFREPSESNRPSYIEFNQAKCYAYLANAYAETEPAQARRYLDRYWQTDFGHTYTGRLMVASVLCVLGDYDKMESVYKEMDNQQATADTVNATYLAMLHDRAVAAEAQGLATKALTFWKRYDVVKGLMAERTMIGKTALQASRYQFEEQQKEWEKDRIGRFKAERRTWFLGILSVIFLVFIAVNHFYYENKLKKMAEQMQPAPVDDIPETEQKHPSTMNDEELFQYLSKIIRLEHLYLNPLLDRQTIIERMGVSAHRIGAAFSKGSEYGSLPGFVRRLRLEHACTLLATRPDMSVKAVGEASGFSNNSTFCSDFKAQYGITPSDFRQGK